MAKFVNGILGGFSGKVGTVVGACWRGIDYMRALATSITNPRTAAQLEQRAKFSLIIAFLRPLTAFLRIGFRGAALKMSAFNAAMAYNVKNAIQGVYPLYAVNYSKVLVSRGALAQALNPVAVSVVAGTIDITWDNNSLEANANDDDEVFFLVYNPATQKATTLLGGAKRPVGTDTINVPESWSGFDVECYIGFSNPNESVFSDSLWIGSIPVL